jgi:hypothetical protein
MGELQHTAGVFAGSPDGREPLDVAVSTISEGPVPMPPFKSTSSIDVKV